MEEQEHKNKKLVVVPSWFTSSVMCVIFALLLIIIYLYIIRYKLVSKAIDMRDTPTSALLLSPEIAFGLAKLI